MAINATLVLFANQGSAANGSDVKVNIGGTYALIAQSGNWNGSTHKLQIKGPNGTGYVDVPNTSMTVDGVVSVDLPGGSIVRGVITTAAPTATFSELRLVK